MLRPGTAPRILSVTQLAARVREALDSAIGTLWVAGEISNCRRQPSGHLYFTLKDDQSQLDAVMFRQSAQTLVFRPADGMDVVVAARVDLYAARGRLQLYVETMEPRGLGALQLAFEELKARLAAEGLFAPARKRPLPPWPRTVGIVTALGGAAIHDLRVTLARRWPLARVVVRPVRVQGPGAGEDVAAGIADLNALGGVDVLVVGRGGGSLEDLWAFNEEVVARAIVASAVPVVSAVGHEVDFTIADFVADERAATPTAAATRVVPDRREVIARVARAEGALREELARAAARARERVQGLERRLGDPRRRVREHGMRLDDLAARAVAGLGRRLAWERREVATLAARLGRSGPAPSLGRTAERVGALGERLRFALGVRTERGRDALGRAAGRLDALSPLACLARGYAIVRRGDAGPIVRDAAALVPGDRVRLLLGRGRAQAVIEDAETPGG